jgi:hypothetical protein
MNLEKRLRDAACAVLSECGDSSKEMIANNIVASFDEMGMAKANPGEFSPEEITDKANLTNTAEMSNDTDFEGKVDGQNDMASGIIDVMNDLTNDMVDISVGSEQCDHCHPENEEKELHILEFGESYLGKYIDKLLGGKTCEQFLLSLTESNYAGPRDWNPDTRINVSDVITTLKREIGDGSESLHVDQVYDDQHNNAYKVSQVDKDLLPKKIQVETTLLELGDDNIYYQNKISDTYPMPK